MVEEPGVLYGAWIISTGLFGTSSASPIYQERKTLADEMRNPDKKQLPLLFLSLYKEISKQYEKEFLWFVFRGSDISPGDNGTYKWWDDIRAYPSSFHYI